jgi:hypothetical protein
MDIGSLSPQPFDLVATGIFFLAIIHTFLAARVTVIAHRVQHRHDDRGRAAGTPQTPSVLAELLHFFGEVELIFGLWVIPLLLAFAWWQGWDAGKHYLNDLVNYTEPVFVVVVMVLASTRPVLGVAEAGLRRIAALGGGTPAAWWLAILTLGPILGSFVTEPAAMTVCALLLARQFFILDPPSHLKYATLGLLFVNVSIGGTLTHFAAPPVLMVARTWNWDTPFMLQHFGWHAVAAIILSSATYAVFFWRQLRALADRASAVMRTTDDAGQVNGPLPVPAWITIVHLAFMAFAVVNSHYPALVLGSFFFFLGFAQVTSAYQGQIDLKPALLVGFFLAGLVIHGGLQGWWISPLLARLSEVPLFAGSVLLTAFNDNALITYLGTLVPSMDEAHRIALVQGAVTGGGLTVIANAPNPAGQALLGKYFDGAVQPLRLLAGALLPTLIAAAMFRLT